VRKELLRARDLREMGLSKWTLGELVRRGLLERRFVRGADGKPQGRGFYARSDVERVLGIGK
jgi:hypothetical protein